MNQMKSVTHGLYGAIIGDVAGSKYEFNNIKTKEFPLFSKGCRYTDDTVMPIAVAKALMSATDDESDLETQLVTNMQKYGLTYPPEQDCYGARFSDWLRNPNPRVLRMQSETPFQSEAIPIPLVPLQAQ